MDETKHVMLVGEGARQFALEQGLPASICSRKKGARRGRNGGKSRAWLTTTIPSPCLELAGKADRWRLLDQRLGLQAAGPRRGLADHR